jgi:tetratricopeptide (TPR) repeat protein
MTLCAAPIRFAFSATLLAVVSMTCAAADRSGSGDISDRETQRCAKIAVAPAVQFQGRMLVELPDIKAPALKRANVLLSNRCFEQALKLLEEHAGQYPDDFQSNYVGARYVWMTRGEDEAEKVLRATLARQPNFISAQVLLAGIHYERGDIVAARAILDEVGSRAPTDVWVYLNRLRIQSLSPTTVPGLRETLLAMAKEPGFPGNVRETAATVGKRLPWMSTQQYEEFLRVQLDFESATPMPCKYANLAGRISRAGGRSREVIALLESPQAYNANCRGLTRNRVFLAEVYLLEAAKISPGPTSANEKLVARARELLDEDFTELVAEVTVRRNSRR